MDNVAYDNTQINERDLTLQAFAVSLARHQKDKHNHKRKSKRASKRKRLPRSRTQKSTPDSTSFDDPYMKEELNALRSSARILKDVKRLSAKIKTLSRGSGHLKSHVEAARRVFQRVIAEVHQGSELNAALQRCVDRSHVQRASDCRQALTFIGELQQVLKPIDQALDQLER